ncbi:MAG TPA: ATP-binding protein [Fibrobacteria bacterium]|nr:ATP-binding protein [Fibrobacteria bacterium]
MEAFRGYKHLFLFALIIGVSTFHYLTPVSFHHFHAIYQRLYYVPILLACYHLGLGAGLAYAAFCGLTYAPHIFFQWSFSAHDSFTQYLEIVMFFVVAGMAGWLFDIRRKQQAELLRQQESLRRADRLALMGKLAAGLAHEIRNPLNSLLGATDILRRGLGPDHPDAEFGLILDSELRRVNRILNEFITFARPRDPDYLPQNLNEVVEAALAITAKTLQDAGLSIEKRLAPDLPETPLDSELLKQALLNLFFNAKESMPKGGALLIETLHEGNELILRISDQGPGIPLDRLEAIFDPFFTSKENGTGLGLSISRQIAEQHGGTLRALPREHGACLELRLQGGKGHE